MNWKTRLLSFAVLSILLVTVTQSQVEKVDIRVVAVSFSIKIP